MADISKFQSVTFYAYIVIIFYKYDICLLWNWNKFMDTHWNVLYILRKYILLSVIVEKIIIVSLSEYLFIINTYNSINMCTLSLQGSTSLSVILNYVEAIHSTYCVRVL